ncbi:ArsR family transcriptional regulator [Halobacterium salinarum]|uniref:Phage PhiH1 repressor protein-like protein n=1 Tax=Halobacterium salinarum (strain ATCC 33171 / DSM 3754 / JCM 8978 / NBRC 102687 / NCIMB 764 / 91-R6) TaxID=2597657 RepID=A0A4D6GUN5_HALS9|nr:ArsR family transcriptional regulator [Halobacterium salinarum]MDL0122662.1 ArsR family transcriptional regulator [Halobacterium salinarum]MDL0124552.1 ArsR family transcriptional regulator [Halobacterium salinarum]MDL0137835.1 ArsR family transcriptional regulator [Halobacterium salinarum]MDL0144415.1 ArsR family transcriptional regulator [Halobacterium salinarum]QCC44826.1 phage PhiH1 repressor protein-like protein [Halobacterium salinarum]
MPRPELAEWMTPMDRDILELLWNDGRRELILNPGTIEANTDWKRQSIRQHILKLREHGLVEYYDEDRALYQLSEHGRMWLVGNLPTEELEEK